MLPLELKPAIVQQNTYIICNNSWGSVCPAEQCCVLYLYGLQYVVCIKFSFRIFLLLTTEVYDMFIYHIVNCGGPMIIDAGFFLLGIPSCSGYLAISAKNCSGYLAISAKI
jgi:hypothetical protein